MTPQEILFHLRKKYRQQKEGRFLPSWTAAQLETVASVPRIPRSDLASVECRQALASLSAKLQAGQWCAFGHLELQVDIPPLWHKDHLSGQDHATQQPAVGLNHRSLPPGSDVKLIWELSRWYQPLQLAQAAFILDDESAAALCIRLLQDWVKRNPPYLGWNWTSALEVGMRLIQFTWIDALLSARGGACAEAMAGLRSSVLPPHVFYAWRYQSFGSSANNHLLGELVGLILATARWPALARWGASLEELQLLWEREVLTQFASDGGNREQALNYQLFSFEFCWQARRALLDAGRTLSKEVEIRITDAARFFWEVQARREPWDYGDSDSAFVSPFFQGERDATQQWYGWVEGESIGNTVRYWMGDPPIFRPGLAEGANPPHTVTLGEWNCYPESGIGVCRNGFWWLRWDLSPLGYLSTAAHGHLDALHLSIWHRGVAFVVDPGTGAYYADTGLRTWLASRQAHNAPCPLEAEEWPKRMGPFLWETHHPMPTVVGLGHGCVQGVLRLKSHRLERTLRAGQGGSSWTVEDRCLGDRGEPVAFTVRWQFAPGTVARMIHSKCMMLTRNDCEMRLEIGDEWANVVLQECDAAHLEASWQGCVSPAFRKVVRAPYLLLTAKPTGDPSCVFSTTFLASSTS